MCGTVKLYFSGVCPYCGSQRDSLEPNVKYCGSSPSSGRFSPGCTHGFDSQRSHRGVRPDKEGYMLAPCEKCFSRMNKQGHAVWSSVRSAQDHFSCFFANSTHRDGHKLDINRKHREERRPREPADRKPTKNHAPRRLRASSPEPWRDDESDTSSHLYGPTKPISSNGYTYSGVQVTYSDDSSEATEREPRRKR